MVRAAHGAVRRANHHYLTPNAHVITHTWTWATRG